MSVRFGDGHRVLHQPVVQDEVRALRAARRGDLREPGHRPAAAAAPLAQRGRRLLRARQLHLRLRLQPRLDHVQRGHQERGAERPRAGGRHLLQRRDGLLGRHPTDATGTPQLAVQQLAGSQQGRRSVVLCGAQLCHNPQPVVASDQSHVGRRIILTLVP